MCNSGPDLLRRYACCWQAPDYAPLRLAAGAAAASRHAKPGEPRQAAAHAKAGPSWVGPSHKRRTSHELNGLPGRLSARPEHRAGVALAGHDSIKRRNCRLGFFLPCVITRSRSVCAPSSPWQMGSPADPAAQAALSGRAPLSRAPAELRLRAPRPPAATAPQQVAPPAAPAPERSRGCRRNRLWCCRCTRRRCRLTCSASCNTAHGW